MVETALGLCRIVDEFTETLGVLLGDPNYLSGRIEESIRTCMESNYQVHYKFGTWRAPKNKKQKRLGQHSEEVLESAEICFRR